jgi:hypothetical protein
MTIAFCFLVYDFIVRYDIWNYFFENIDDKKYVVYIHPKNNIYKDYNFYKFNHKIVNHRINTISKDHISIVNAILQLLKETYIHNNNITHFIFLSQSCIPLYNFNKIYEITTKFNYSVVSSIDNNKKERYHQLQNNIKKYIKYSDFVKQQPNMILIKNDVIDLLNNNYTLYFNNMQCPDEHYFINILLNILKKKIIKQQINFCNYDLNKTQAIEFNLIDKNLLDKVRSYGFLFMRKINKNSIIDKNYIFKPIDDELPVIY